MKYYTPSLQQLPIIKDMFTYTAYLSHPVFFDGGLSTIN